jgi:predicted permease
MKRLGWFEGAVQDVRYAARVLARQRAFSSTAVLILSVGIGLNLTFFHLLNVTTLRPLSVNDPATLIRLQRRGPTSSSSHLPYPATLFIREHNDVLSAVLTHHRSEVVWAGDSASKVPIAFVSANWFNELGYDASFGRVFSASIDERGGADPTVVVSDEFWRTRLGSDPSVVGRTVRLNDRVATVIGVAPPRFPDLDLQDPQMWLPIHQIDYFEPGNTFKDAWSDNNTALYARLRPGVSPQAAADALRVTLVALAHTRPNDFKAGEWLEAATAEGRFLHARGRQKLLAVAALFGGLTLLVLLVASANLANLVLSHALGRMREFSVRMALGASRWRVLHHIVVECGLLAAFGAVGGIVVAYTSARLFAATTELPPYLDFTPDGRLLIVAVGVALLAMVAFGLVPAWMVSRRDLIGSLRDGGHQASAGLSRARFRLALVAAQVLGCCALLVVAGSMARGLERLVLEEPGFAFARVAVLDPSLDRHGVAAAAARAYWSHVVSAVASHPDLDQVALTSVPPLGGAIHQARYGADSGPLSIAVMHVEPAFFSLLEIPIVAGRTFERGDDSSVVVISQRLALTMYGTLDVVGKGYPRTKPTRTIVGVAADAMVAELRASNAAEEYMPLRPGDYQSAVLLAKSRSNPQNLLTLLNDAARAADVRVQPGTHLLAREYERNLRAPALASTIAALVAGLVLTLACLGIFGVVAYAVKLRMKEIGIRRALGADARAVFATLLRQLAWPVGIGVVVGTTGGFAASRALAAPPFHLAIPDALAPTAALTIFVLAGLAAALVPASRAMRADPIDALRQE